MGLETVSDLAYDTVSEDPVISVFSGASCATFSAVSGATEVSKMDDVTFENTSNTDELRSTDTYKSDQVFESLALTVIVSEFYKGSCKCFLSITPSQRNRLRVSLSHFKTHKRNKHFSKHGTNSGKNTHYHTRIRS